MHLSYISNGAAICVSQMMELIGVQWANYIDIKSDGCMEKGTIRTVLM
jgi:hypothetical protein